jgi:hypothetical protein
MSGTFSRRLLLSVDAVGYGSGDDIHQRGIQAALLAVLAVAAERARLDRDRWMKQPAGDGELAILPHDLSDRESDVVDDFVRELHAALSRHNRDLRDEARLRLRLAVHHGVAIPAENGYAGQGVVAVSRLVDAAAVKAALRAVPAANLALVLSERVLLDVVAQGHTSVPSTAFRAISVRNKEFDETGYLHLPGYDVHKIPAGLLEQVPPAHHAPEPDTESEPVPRPATSHVVPPAVVTSTFHGTVDAPGGVFGIQWKG